MPKLSEIATAVADDALKAMHNYLDRFDGIEEAADFEDLCLGAAVDAGDEFIPPFVITVINGGIPLANYWDWLSHRFDLGQEDSMDDDSGYCDDSYN